MRDVIQHWFDHSIIDLEAEGFYPIEEDVMEFLPSFDEGASSSVDEPLWTDDKVMAVCKLAETDPHHLVKERMATVVGRAFGAPVAPVRLCKHNGTMASFSLVMASFQDAANLQSTVQQLEVLQTPEDMGAHISRVFGTHARAYDQLGRCLALELLSRNDDASWYKHSAMSEGLFYLFDYNTTKDHDFVNVYAPWHKMNIDPEDLLWQIPQIVKGADWGILDKECAQLTEAFPHYAAIITLYKSQIDKTARELMDHPPTGDRIPDWGWNGLLTKEADKEGSFGFAIQSMSPQRFTF
jgi:hypothetical protein